MTDLISRQALCEYALNQKDKSITPNEIMRFPSAEPVKHGKWIDIDEQTYTWKIRCSCCGYERSMLSTQGKYPNYCEACGADMRGTEDGDK